jgi:hypothetical protein
VTRLRVRRPGFDCWQGLGFFLVTVSILALGSAQPPVQLVPGVKWPVREANYSPLSSAEVKDMWSYTPLPSTSS